VSVPLLSLDDRPRFAAKMVAVWRWHHMRAGEELSVTVHRGEWPDGVPHEVKGCQVVEHDTAAGGPGGMLALGRADDSWRWAYNMAVDEILGWSIEELALISIYGEVPTDGPLKIWMSPSPLTGEVPMWLAKRGGAS
jgi:hypothetical protein